MSACSIRRRGGRGSRHRFARSRSLGLHVRTFLDIGLAAACRIRSRRPRAPRSITPEHAANLYFSSKTPGSVKSFLSAGILRGGASRAATNFFHCFLSRLKFASSATIASAADRALSSTKSLRFLFSFFAALSRRSLLSGVVRMLSLVSFFVTVPFIPASPNVHPLGVHI